MATYWARWSTGTGISQCFMLDFFLELQLSLKLAPFGGQARWVNGSCSLLSVTWVGLRVIYFALGVSNHCAL